MPLKSAFVRSRSKYGNRRTTTIDGITFQSKAEARLYSLLRLLERAGRLKIEALQEKIYLTDAKILYKPDFTIRLFKADPAALICEGYPLVWVECKGFETPSWKIKARLFAAYRPRDSILVYKMQTWGPKLVRVVGKPRKCVFGGML